MTVKFSRVPSTKVTPFDVKCSTPSLYVIIDSVEVSEEMTDISVSSSDSTSGSLR